MMWLLVLVIGLNRSLLTTRSVENQFMDAYTVKVSDDTTAYMGVGIYNAEADYTTIYLLKLINGFVSSANYLGAVYGHCTSLDITFIGDSVFTIFSGDSGYIYLYISDRSLNPIETFQITEGFKPKIYSAKIMVISHGVYKYGYSAYSFRGNGGSDTLVVTRKQFSPGNAEAQLGFAVSYEPYVVDLDYSIGLDTFFVYVSREATDPNNPSVSRGVINVYTDALTTEQFTTRMEYELYPFGLEENIKYMTVAAESCHAIAIAQKEDGSGYFISYNHNFGRGQWSSATYIDDIRNDYFITSYFLNDTSFFPMIWGMSNGSIFIEKFKIPRNQQQGTWESMWEITENPTYQTFPLAFTYHSARMSLYRKRLEYSPSLTSHLALWHQDFYHYTPTWPHLPVLDSTTLWIDYDYSPGVGEGTEQLKVMWDMKTKVLRISKCASDKSCFVNVFDIFGRKILNSEIPYEGVIPLKLSRGGIYIIKISSQGRVVFCKKIIYWR
ncbi:MAG: T9SS type A sorting domain-containing protein [candidate division WOR-3 bacterium]